ncbi:Non-structural maintenance of chromosomes element 4 [Entamoeba marina]
MSQSSTQSTSSQSHASGNTLTRTEIRIKLRKLTQEVNDKREILSNPTNSELQEVISDISTVSQQIKFPREAAMESECFKLTSELSNTKTQRIQTGFQTFSNTTLVSALLEEYGDNNTLTNDALAKIAEEVLKGSWKLAPSYPLTDKKIVINPPRDKKKIVKKPPGKLETPDDINASDYNKDNETTERVESVKKILKDSGKMPFYVFVLDDKNFSHTIENMFHTSFLVKDGFASISNEDGVPYISPVNPSSSKSTDKSHVVYSLDYDEWCELVERVGDRFIPSIPHRDVSKDGLQTMMKFGTQPLEIKTSSQKSTPPHTTPKRKHKEETKPKKSNQSKRITRGTHKK